jgi:hypothetical protein
VGPGLVTGSAEAGEPYLDLLNKANMLAGLQNYSGSKIRIRKSSPKLNFIVKKGNRLTAVEVKSGKVKNSGGSLIFKKLYPEARSLIVGSVLHSLEDFLSGKIPLF